MTENGRVCCYFGITSYFYIVWIPYFEPSKAILHVELADDPNWDGDCMTLKPKSRRERLWPPRLFSMVATSVGRPATNVMRPV